MDKTRKVLTIILITLSIISVTFGLCKKVGLCASSDDTSISFNPPPLLYGSGIGGYDVVDHSVVLQCLDYAITHSPNYSDYTWLCVPYYVSPFSTYQRFAVMCVSDNVGLLDFTNNFIVDYIISYDFLMNGGYNTTVNNGRFTIQVANVYENVSGDNIYKQSQAHYPVWVYNPDKFNNTNGQQIFAELGSDTPEVPGGHTKGGNITDYVPVNDSDVDVANVTPSSNNTNNFLQKITNILQNLLKSVQNGFTNVVDNLKNFWNPIMGWLENAWNEITETIEHGIEVIVQLLTGLKDIVESDSEIDSDDVKEEWVTQFENSDLYGFVTLHQSVKGIFEQFLNLSAPEHLSFTYNLPSFNLGSGFGSAYVLGRTITIDFDWYAQHRNAFISILAPLLYLSFIYMLWVKIPSIINGSSGVIQDVGKTGNKSLKGGVK